MDEGVLLEEWDAVAEMEFGGDVLPMSAGKQYYETVIVPDEKCFLLSAALEHLLIVDGGSVEGDRTEFVRDGKPVIDYVKWQAVWQEVEGVQE